MMNSISAFEYITILISIILGLGITHILSSLVRLLHIPGVQSYWPHMIWVLLVLLLHIQEWFVLYELKDLKAWRMVTFLFVILYPINLFILANLLFPLNIDEENCAFKPFYFEHIQKISIFACTLVLLSVLHNVFLLNLGIATQVPQGVLLLVFIFLVLRPAAPYWVHKAIAVFLLTLSVASVVVSYDTWIIR